MSPRGNPLPLIDGHVDLLYMMRRKWPGRHFAELNEGEVTPLGLEEGNVRVLVSAFYCEDTHNGPGRSLPHLQELLHYAEHYLSELPVIRSREDLNDCMEGAGGPGALNLLENADALADDIAFDLKGRGFVAAGLTHAGRNRLGDGNGVASPEGLTPMGRQVARALNRQGVVLDVAHLAEPCFWDVMDLFDGALISSHTGFRRFCDMPRNLSNEQVKILMARHGTVGVSVNPEMLTPDGSATIRDVFEQVDGLVQKYGFRGVALGSDFGGFDGENEGLEHMGRLQDLAELLSRQGYPDPSIAAILGENWYQLYSSMLPSPDPPRS
ncbi:MAG: membrane dipeptidase [Deltaproteobacteria bacterium]|nr:membrane dipeptidase [Deltaproteobacteria bacterium]